MIKNIIFDLDGTIADDANLMMSLVDMLCKKNGYKSFGLSGLNKIRGLGTIEFISQIGIKKEDISSFVNEMSTQLAKNYKQVKPVKSIDKLIEELVSKKHFLAIVTTNQKGNVINFLKKFGINISVIYDQAGLHGKTKLLENCIMENKLDKNESVYVGDEDRDILSAKESGLKSIGVTWGLASKKVLKSLNPDYIISKPKELLKIIK